MTTTKQTRSERLMPNGIPRYIRVYDDHWSADCYTVVFTGSAAGKANWPYLGMSRDPFHPQGIGVRGEGASGGRVGPIDRPRYAHLGKKIEFLDLPEPCRKLVVSDYKAIWEIAD